MSDPQETPAEVTPTDAGNAAPATADSPGEPRTLLGKWWFWLPWPLLVALDLWSKAAVFSFMAERWPDYPEMRRPPYVVWEDVGGVHFEFVTWGNTGTIWGLFQNGTVILMVLRCFALLALLWFVRTTAQKARVQQFVLSLVFAGAIGNLYDNFVRADRSVRDFLHFYATWPFEWDFPAFNVADSCITVGAIGLFVLLWRDDRSQQARAKG